ncbi:MAG: DNA polymerase III subunit alpha [Bacteroidales bacterium]
MWLNCHSYYSLQCGVLSPELLLKEATSNNVSMLALTDIDTTMGIPEFIKVAKNYPVHVVAGMEVGSGDFRSTVFLARDREGLKEINDYISKCNLSGKKVGSLPFEFLSVYVIYRYGQKDVSSLKENEYLGFYPWELSSIIHKKRLFGAKACVLAGATFSSDSDYTLHCNLKAIKNNTLLSKLSNEEKIYYWNRFSAESEYKDLLNVFSDWLDRSSLILKDCSIFFDFKKPKNKQVFSSSFYDDRMLLEKLAIEGLSRRYCKVPKALELRLRNELDVINRLGFSAYFLIAWDIIRYSMSNNIYHVGRGSGANSIVAYCLQITNVDPVELDLYFERFLNSKRTSPPDFDIDYSWKDRKKVQDYIFRRYGQEHTALLGATQTFRGRSIFREFGKVKGLPLDDIENLSRSPERYWNTNDLTKEIWSLAKKVKNFPYQRSIHAGGILISEEPLTYYTALDLSSKGFPVTQWDMHIAEDLNYEKLDILSQRGIGHIEETVEVIKYNRGEQIDVFQIDKFKEDKLVKEQLKLGETLGCFYIESPGMRSLLTKLKCDNYLSLVAASSIIRPGVAQSGMMKAYIERSHNPKLIAYLHPIMQEQLKETYGVMVYQEDVLKVCHHFAGLDLSDADTLRRMMSGKERSNEKLEKLRNHFFDLSRKKGREDYVIYEVWRQISSFAAYSFSKAHSASYAVESFQSLYLKTYYPLEFMVAVINNHGGFYASWVYFYEAMRFGATINLPSVNHSELNTCIKDKDIYIGFSHILDFENKWANRIKEERQSRGLYKSLQDFFERVMISKDQLILLIRVGAFRFTGKSRGELMWEAQLLNYKKSISSYIHTLYTKEEKGFKLPKLKEDLYKYTWDEIDLLGFPVSLSYFDLLETKYRASVNFSNLMNYLGHEVRMMGILVCVKYVKTKHYKLMCFATFLDVEGNFFDGVIFPEQLQKYPFRGIGVYLLKGKVVEEFLYPSLEINKLAKLPYKSRSIE